MRIAIDCRYIRERPSGIGAYVGALVERLPAIAPNDQFQLWTHRLAPRLLSDAPNVTEQAVHTEPNSLWSLSWPKRYVSFGGIDLLHVPHNTLPRAIPCPTVVTIHDLMVLERRELAFTRWSQRIKRSYYPQAVWRALRCATRVIVTTSATATRAVELWPAARGRVVVVPLAAEQSFRPPVVHAVALQQAATLTGSAAPFVLVVGQDAPNKRQEVALRAFAAGAPASWRLVLVQRQSHGGALRLLARSLGIDGRVTWLATVAPGELVTLYQAARVLLQPSNYEGFGMPVLEAMSCGCAVITSDIATWREVVGGGGATAPVDDVAGFARVLRAVADSPAMREELAAAAVERSRRYSWERCARETLEVYRAASSAA